MTRQPTSVDLHVSNRLRARREHLGISQGELARQLGISGPQFQKYENGENRISAGKLFELAIALKTSIPYFYEGLESVTRALLRGVSEEAVEFEGPPNAETVELLTVFGSIKDASARKAVLSLARKSSGLQLPRKRS